MHGGYNRIIMQSKCIIDAHVYGTAPIQFLPSHTLPPLFPLPRTSYHSRLFLNIIIIIIIIPYQFLLNRLLCCFSLSLSLSHLLLNLTKTFTYMHTHAHTHAHAHTFVHIHPTTQSTTHPSSNPNHLHI